MILTIIFLYFLTTLFKVWFLILNMKTTFITINKNKIILPFLLLLLLIFTQPLQALSHYSYEHAEELKHLIEWYDYSPEAFQEATIQNKPIFLLLTAPSWCYWCQVYESEEYLFHPELYPYINENFIPVYVDADQRQDLTRKYLEGGWPSTTILTPNRERMFGYSGARPSENILINLEKSVEYVNSNKFSTQISYTYKKTSIIIPTESQLAGLIDSYSSIIIQSYDSKYGGFGFSSENTQKFPQAKTLDFSLELYELTNDNQWLELVQNTLQNQYTKIDELTTNYNLFDPIEGGFHRYGTRRDWTPPHYEKMLYDNARLLKTYFHLFELTPNEELVNEVVKKTHNYIKENWYDDSEGGFYGNTDVHGEDEYYGKNPRPSEKPRVEKTKYSDWNSEAILTYLYLTNKTENEEYKEMAKKSLDFFASEMITDKGAYHYSKDNKKEVRGNLLDNSYLLLAFIEGYEILGDEKYLITAKKIADYSLENLYDWNSGGFFERNSPDTELYALGENIDLSKPTQENAIISYALLKLYKQTNDVRYLNSGIKTLGSKINEAGGLDRGYYIIKSSQLILESDLLSEYNTKQSEIKKIEQEKLKDFWVNDFITQDSNNLADFVASDKGLEKLETPIIFLLIVAFFAGLLSFISPCTLPILPAYIAYTFEASKKNVKGMTFSFFLGLALVFTILGMSATFLGNFLKSNITIFTQVTGIIIIFFGIYILLGKGFTGLKIRQNKPTTYAGSFIFGSILGLSWTPCIGPILVAILLLASTSSSTISGGLLLFSYAAGLALPLLLFSTYLSKTNKDGKVWKIIKGKELRFIIGKKTIIIHSTSLISGLLFIIIGYLIFSGALFTFNQYVGTSSFQKWIFSLEDKILGMLG